MRSELIVRFDYGRDRAVGAPRSTMRWRWPGPDALCLRTPAPVRGEDDDDRLGVHGRAGQRVPFVLTWFPSHRDLPERSTPESALGDDGGYWQEWARSGTKRRYHDEVHQSLLVLKALTYGPTGGHRRGADDLAARADRRGAQLGLPLLLAARRHSHSAGDARGGYHDEAASWSSGCCGRSRAIRPTSRSCTAWPASGGSTNGSCDWLPGYEGSRARPGRQRRLDPAPARRLRRGAGRAASEAASTAVDQTRTSGRWLASCWGGSRTAGGRTDCRDLGGARAGPPLHPLEGDGLGGVRPRGAVPRRARAARAGRALAGDPRRDPRRGADQAWSEEKQAFTQSYGSEELDASVLLMPLVGFIAGDRPADGVDGGGDQAGAARSTGWSGATPARRDDVDGLPGGEGVFLACSFWLVEVLAAAGRARRGPASCSSGCSTCATTSDCWPRSTTRRRAASSATSRRPSPTWRWSAPRSPSATAAPRRGGRISLGGRTGRLSVVDPWSPGRLPAPQHRPKPRCSRYRQNR